MNLASRQSGQIRPAAKDWKKFGVAPALLGSTASGKNRNLPKTLGQWIWKCRNIPTALRRLGTISRLLDECPELTISSHSSVGLVVLHDVLNSPSRSFPKYQFVAHLKQTQAPSQASSPVRDEADSEKQQFSRSCRIMRPVFWLSACRPDLIDISRSCYIAT